MRYIIQFLVTKNNEHQVETLNNLCMQWGVDQLNLKTLSLDISGHEMDRQDILYNARKL